MTPLSPIENRPKNITTLPEYSIWTNMKQRCGNPRDPGYHNYGGRGINVCQEWERSFETFYLDMGKRPSKKHSLERVDNDKEYSKNNCIWAVKVQQIRNRRVTMKAMYNGVNTPVAAIAEENGLAYQFLTDRLRTGWTVEEAIKYPPNTKIDAMRKTPICHLINEIHAVELPPEAYKWNIYKRGRENPRLQIVNKNWTSLISYSLPPGSYEILFTTINCSEEQAGSVARWFELNGKMGWKNYQSEHVSFPFKTAIESLRSLLRANALSESKNYLLIKKVS